MCALQPGGVRGLCMERLLLPPHLVRSFVRLVHLPAQHGRLWRCRRVPGVSRSIKMHVLCNCSQTTLTLLFQVCSEDGVHPSQISSLPAASSQRECLYFARLWSVCCSYLRPQHKYLLTTPCVSHTNNGDQRNKTMNSSVRIY